MANSVTQSILVVGGGMAGLTAAIEAAETGYDVYLIEKNAYLGGRVAQLHKYFPKLCPPYCGLEINFRRMKNSPNARFFTLAEVETVSGQAGDYDVAIRLKPRYVNEKCTACGKCAEACGLEIDNPFNYGLDKIKAAYLPHEMAFPYRYVLDPSLVKSAEAQKVKDACPYGAIELDMTPKTMNLKVGAIIWATGWDPYDLAKLDLYGAGQYKNVVNNVGFERLAALNGPTQGRIVRPSDGQAPSTIAFVQCAGSRDENHLGFCSGICCLASLKQATYVREKLPEAKIYFFFIDLRATDRLEDFYAQVKKDDKIVFFKGKVAKITEDPVTKSLLLRVENTATGQLSEISVDLAVLATGMQPTAGKAKPPLKVRFDDYGFIPADSGQAGFIGAGCARTPTGVSEAVADGTAAALKAIQVIARR
ncbi:MAG: CoB--CoM heterodisulfide reductase iron-sulfur subunit A family protein [Thermodesulfobacteriota bacterium]